MDDPIRRLRTEARQLADGKSPTAVRYPAACRATALTLARPRLGRSIGAITARLTERPLSAVPGHLAFPRSSQRQVSDFQASGPAVPSSGEGSEPSEGGDGVSRAHRVRLMLVRPYRGSVRVARATFGGPLVAL